MDRLSKLIRTIALALLCSAALVAPAHADAQPPARITVNAPIHSVYCMAGVCCGQADAVYRGHYYDLGARGYCRWFRPLRDGDIVRVTLRLEW